MVSIPYHIDDGGAVLSLCWANEDREQVNEVEIDKRTNIDQPLEAYRSRICTYTNTEPTIHCLYEAKLHERNSWDIEAILSGLDDSEEVLVLPVIDAFQGIQDDWERDGKVVKWYKEPEIERILRTFDTVDYRQTVPEVGGELLSRFITEHPLPNANHRVALSILEMYLSTYEDGFELPNTGVTGEWSDWAEGYVHQSKQIMTLARKTGLLRTLERYGCERVVRDGDNVIDFADYDLSVPNYTDHFKQMHREESTAFVYGVLDRTNNVELLSRQDDGKETLINRLSS